MPTFDTHAAVKNLEQAGFTVGQAEAIVAVQRQADDALATKSDVDALESPLKVFVPTTVLGAAGIIIAAVKLL